MIPPERFLTSSLRDHPAGGQICTILSESIHSADPGEAVHRHLLRDGDSLILNGNRIKLADFSGIYLIAIGKASLPMLEAIIELMGDRVTAGVGITKDAHLGTLDHPIPKRLKIVEASHPIPNQRNLDGTKLITKLAGRVTANDLVVCLISGGGSALLTLPAAGISLGDLQILSSLLIKSGASIQEINTIRKHIDQMKGGGLLKMLYPATVISLILSDVIGNDLNTVASGPTAPDPTTFSDSWKVLERYQLMDAVPASIRAHIRAGIEGRVPETMKKADPILFKVTNQLIGSNLMAIQAAVETARRLGFHTIQPTTPLQGEASLMGARISDELVRWCSKKSTDEKPTCSIYGGETTVTVTGDGLGGRNQEFALAAVKNLSQSGPAVLITLATDGGDGPTDATGAVVTSSTYQRGLRLGMAPEAYLNQNDSYHYFDSLGDLIRIGPTLTNVNDLVLAFCF